MTEQISALVDGALDSEDIVQTLTTMQTNKQAAEAWHYYHLIGDAMRNTHPLNPHFKHNLMQQLELEPTVLAPNAVQSKLENNTPAKNILPMRWSIAASVAAISVVSWMALQMPTQSQDITLIAKHADSNTTLTARETPKPVKSSEIPTEYLVAHQAFAPSASSYYVQTASYAE